MKCVYKIGGMPILDPIKVQIFEFNEYLRKLFALHFNKGVLISNALKNYREESTIR